VNLSGIAPLPTGKQAIGGLGGEQKVLGARGPLFLQLLHSFYSFIAFDDPEFSGERRSKLTIKLNALMIRII
jgi:hypothetical protein